MKASSKKKKKVKFITERLTTFHIVSSILIPFLLWDIIIFFNHFRFSSVEKSCAQISSLFTAINRYMSLLNNSTFLFLHRIKLQVLKFAIAIGERIRKMAFRVTHSSVNTILEFSWWDWENPWRNYSHDYQRECDSNLHRLPSAHSKSEIVITEAHRIFYR